MKVSSERNTTASLRTAPQPGFWEDPKRMRPLGTQRPERPKSELGTTNTKKCGLSKACSRPAYRNRPASIPRRGGRQRAEWFPPVWRLRSISGAEIFQVDSCYYPLE